MILGMAYTFMLKYPGMISARVCPQKKWSA